MFYAFPTGYHFYQLAGRYGLPAYHDLVAIPADAYHHPDPNIPPHPRVIPLLPAKSSENRQPPSTREQMLAAMQREADLLQIRHLDRPFSQLLAAANDRARQIRAAGAYRQD